MYNRIKTIAARIRISHVIIIWLLINMVSSRFTLLYTDETYYKLFSQQLAFGYFDHPPMVALFIWVGSVFSNSETGVRMVSVLAIAAALYFCYKLSGVQKPVLFLVAILSVFALNLLGFMALPDAPLLLFTVLFFVVYKSFLLKENPKNIILLGLVMAGLLYSKYHGIMVILFTLASNIRLLKSYKFWLAGFLGVLLFVPHMLWQYNNNFVTFSYHLVERSASGFKFSVTIEYIIGQILFYGPFTAFFMYAALLKYKVSDQFEKALVLNIWGIICFFFLSSLKGRVEVNWTLPVIVPLLIIFMKYAYANTVFRKWFYIFAGPSVVLILLFRIQMIYPVFRIRISRIDDLRGQKEFVQEVIAKSEGLPIIAGSYQKAGLISYYSGAFVPAINLNGRRNQFNLWHADDSLRFRKVAYVNSYLDKGKNIENPLYSRNKVSIIDSLPVMSELVITAEPHKIHCERNMELVIKVMLNTTKSYNYYRDAGDYHTRLHAELYNNKDSLLSEQICSLPVNLLLKNNNGKYSFRISSPGEKGRYKILIALQTTTLGTWSTKKVIDLIIN